MNKQHEDSFDLFLRNELQKSQLYIDDDKFSVQIMAKIPSTQKLKNWQEILILFLPCIIISVFVLSQFSIVSFVVRGWVLLTLMNIADLLRFAALLIAAMTVFVGGWWVKQENIL